MAALGERIFARLTTYAETQALIGNRCYPQVLPQNPVLPAVVYEELPGNTSDGWGVIRTARVRITCWAETKAVAVTVAGAVAPALRHYQERSNLPHLIGMMDEGRLDVYDPDAVLFGSAVDFEATLVE